MGNTKVIASVYGPRETKQKANIIHDRALIKCQYSMAPFSTSSRRAKRSNDRRFVEIAMTIQQNFESVIHLHLFPRSEIDIFIQVLESDGGELSAAINAASLALIDAGIPMKDFLVSSTVGYLDKTALTDLNQTEIMAGGPTMSISTLPSSNKVLLMQMDSKVPFEVFEEISKLAVDGCKAIYDILSNEVKEHSLTLLEAKGVVL
jgi:exosome complex component RRP41